MSFKSLLFLCFWVLQGCLFSSSSLKEYRWAGETMGTVYRLTFWSPPLSATQFSSLIHSFQEELETINQQMSTWRAESEISRFNRHHSQAPFAVSPGFFEVLAQAQQVSMQSEGAFDPTVMPLVNLWGFGPGGPKERAQVSAQKLAEIKKSVGMNQLLLQGPHFLVKKTVQLQLDLSAIAKGYGVDRLASLLEGQGVQHYLVEIGGEVRTGGFRDGDSRPWRLGIEVPQDRAPTGEALQKVITLKGEGLATSGDYRNFYELGGKRYSHSIDPRSGRPVEHALASASVVAPTAMLADALATAVMVLGPQEGLKLIDSMSGVEALLLVREGKDGFQELFSRDFKKYLKVD